MRVGSSRPRSPDRSGGPKDPGIQNPARYIKALSAQVEVLKSRGLHRRNMDNVTHAENEKIS